MSQQTETLKRIFQAIDAHDVDQAVRLMGEGVRLSLPGASDLDGDAFKVFTRPFHVGFPNARHEIDVVVEQGDTIAAEGTWKGTHSGTMATPRGDVPATGRTVDMRWCGIFTNVGGPGARARVYFDQAELAEQLGLVPQGA